MLRACLDGMARPPASAMVVAPGGLGSPPAFVSVFQGGHPVPTEASVEAGRFARMTAESAEPRDVLLVLLSGGASALMVLPSDGVTLADKQATSTRLMRAGADITTLNIVRKHLSALKGGQLAAATRARTVCLAISDVVGDDPSVIGSGPTVADPSTYGDALAVLDRFGGREAYPPVVVRVLAAGQAGGRRETPKPGDAVFARTDTRVIATRLDAVAGAVARARALGYDTVVLEEPVLGEARVAAGRFASEVRAITASHSRPFCVVSSGETTVTVTGTGRGGRNQEFALAIIPDLAAIEASAAFVSVGTDGVDGPTDAAGGVVTSATEAVAAAAGVDVRSYLRNNDAYACLSRLDGLVMTGPTGTNVGDVQVALISPEPRTST